MSRHRVPIRPRLACIAAAAGVLWVLSITVRADMNGSAQVQANATAVTLPAPDEPDILRGPCLRCHGIDLLAQQRLSRTGWERELEKMTAWGAIVEASERIPLLDYLTLHFGEGAAPATATVAFETAAAATLLQTRCLTCHGVDLIDSQRLDAAGWGREIDKVANWGAAVAGSDKDRLVEYLTRSR